MQEPTVTARIVRFGVFEADGRTRELRKRGVRIRLQEQPFQVLWLLLERAGEVVTREQLRQKVWPSSVFVDFDHGLNNAVARVRDALGDTAGSPRFVETLPRLGYRFVCPVAGDTADATPAREITPGAAYHRHAWAGGLIAVLALALLVTLWLVRRSSDDGRGAGAFPTPSLAVLPFADASEDAQRDDFADGFSEELLNKLAAIHGLRVAGRASSFNFKDTRVPTKDIAAALKVDHLLEGTVRLVGARVQMTARLIDAQDGKHLWSQTYDREFTDIFAVQEDIAMSVSAVLHVKLLEQDKLRIRERGTHDPEAYRFYLMAQTQLRGHGPRNLASAKQLFDAALARDPEFADAHAGLALFYFRDAWVTLADVERSARLGRSAAERAVALAPKSSEALDALANFDAWQSRFRGDFQAYTRAQSGYRRAIELDPDRATAYFSFGRGVEWDQPESALQMFERAADLDPLFSSALGRATDRLVVRGMRDAARQRLKELDAQPLLTGEPVFAVSRGMLEMRLGHLDEALTLLPKPNSLEFDLLRWSLYMSLGDPAGARAALTTRADPLAQALRAAAALSMEGRAAEAFAALDRHRLEFPLSHALDLPVARFALISGHAELALPILERRLPDLVRGMQPVSARNVIPALDLVAAYQATDRREQGQQLLQRIAAFLDGPDAPWMPMFTYLRARAHVLAGESQLALRALDRAYDAGFRKICAVDLNPQPMFYLDCIDADPVFAPLRADPQYRNWRERIRLDNARQLERLTARVTARPAP